MATELVLYCQSPSRLRLPSFQAFFRNEPGQHPFCSCECLSPLRPIPNQTKNSSPSLLPCVRAFLPLYLLFQETDLYLFSSSIPFFRSLARRGRRPGGGTHGIGFLPVPFFFCASRVATCSLICLGFFSFSGFAAFLLWVQARRHGVYFSFLRALRCYRRSWHPLPCATSAFCSDQS